MKDVVIASLTILVGICAIIIFLIGVCIESIDFVISGASLFILLVTTFLIANLFEDQKKD